MIFNKIFNIIRNITTWPFFLIKNKLLVERSNKSKNIFTNLITMFKNSTWSFNDSINTDFMFKYKNYIKYTAVLILIILLNTDTIYNYIINSDFIIFNLWKSLDLYNLFMKNCYFFYFWFVKILITNFNTFFYINKKNLVKFENFFRSKNTTLKYNKSNFKINKKNNLSSDAINFIVIFYNNILINNEFNSFMKLIINSSTISNTYLKKKNNYINYIYTKNYNTGDVINFKYIINSDVTNITNNLDKSEFKYNLNLNLVYENLFKNLEYFKWLYKYTISHSRSFFESQYLNLKLIPVGSSNNQINSLNFNSVYNYYINSINSKFNYKTDLKIKNNINNFKFILTHNNNSNINGTELISFSTLPSNFNNFFYKYKYLNDFIFMTLINFKLVRQYTTPCNNVIINKNITLVNNLLINFLINYKLNYMVDDIKLIYILTNYDYINIKYFSNNTIVIKNKLIYLN